VGNPAVSIESAPYGNGTTARFSPATPFAALTALLVPVTEFKFCNTQFKVISSSGSDLVEATLGLLNVSDASATTPWGDVPVADESLSVQELRFELHVDPENCGGATYSVRYNGQELTKDLEFHFAFASPVPLSAGSTVSLGMTAIATALENASQAGMFDNENIASYLTTETKGTAEESGN
jgi:hypothetical protein